MGKLRRLARDLGGLAVVTVLLLTVTLLPPDTALREVEASGALRVCVPTRYPPLVTGDPDRPGIDVEILRAVAEDMGVSLLLNPIEAMGRDFNPRNWSINRGKCQVLAGGVVDSPLTRSFLDTGPPYAETGWAIVAPQPVAAVSGKAIGALTLVSGLDRIGLSGYLRRESVTVRVMRSEQALVEAISAGTVEAGITEALLAAGLAAGNGWWSGPLPAELARYNLVFGLWKGDLTLKRRISRVLRRMEADGTLAAILARYGVAPLGTD